MRSSGTRRLGRIAACTALLCLAGCASWTSARLYHSGTEALDAGEIPEAVSALERARGLTPEVSEVRNHLGLAYLAQDRRAEALDELRSAVALDCRNDAARWNLRALEASLGIGPDEEWSGAALP